MRLSFCHLCQVFIIPVILKLPGPPDILYNQVGLREYFLGLKVCQFLMDWVGRRCTAYILWDGIAPAAYRRAPLDPKGSTSQAARQWSQAQQESGLQRSTGQRT